MEFFFNVRCLDAEDNSLDIDASLSIICGLSEAPLLPTNAFVLTATTGI